MKEVNKPVTLRLSELKQNLVNDINSAGLPMWAVQPVLVDLYNQVSNAANNEAKHELEQYNAAVAVASKEEAEVVENE